MCGRYTIIAKAEEVAKRFNVVVPETYKPQYNAAPSQILPVITNASPDGLSFFHWGLIPHWAKDKSISSKLINARAETLTEKASFRNALKQRRCLVVADGFYEWKKSSKKSKIPYRIHFSDTSLFSFAGLWEEYEDEERNLVHTFSIITTSANDTVSKIHDRMPVVLNPETEKIWLGSEFNSDKHIDLLKPYSADKTEYYSVSSRVNSTENNDPELILPAPPADQFGNYSLFD